MAARKYSLKTDADKQLSANFKVKEFRCKDGSDTVYIDQGLVDILQKIAEHFKQGVSITSGYRTNSYNKKVGGASASQHLLGTAADITVKNTNNSQVAIYAESLLAKRGGIGFYDYSSGFVHIDVRAKRSRWKQDRKNGSSYNVSGFYAEQKPESLKRTSPPMKGSQVEFVQKLLGVDADGIYGAKTEKAVMNFQKLYALKIDGIVGTKTWNKMLEVAK